MGEATHVVGVVGMGPIRLVVGESRDRQWRARASAEESGPGHLVSLGLMLMLVPDQSSFFTFSIAPISNMAQSQ